MTRDDLLKLRNANPFRPFVVHVAGQRSFQVPHRDFLFLAASGRIVEIFLENGTRHIVDLMLVTDLEVPAAKDGIDP
jgi:hypothetical protein